jgi:hypothetical protein
VRNVANELWRSGKQEESNYFLFADHPPGMRRGMAGVSSTSPLSGACKILVGGTKISARLSNL